MPLLFFIGDRSRRSPDAPDRREAADIARGWVPGSEHRQSTRGRGTNSARRKGSYGSQGRDDKGQDKGWYWGKGKDDKGKDKGLYWGKGKDDKGKDKRWAWRKGKGDKGKGNGSYSGKDNGSYSGKG